MAVDINITPIIREVTIEVGQGGGGAAVWGGITGTLSNQTDLALQQTAQDDAIALNTAKVGITPTQASDITTNNAKVSSPILTAYKTADESKVNDIVRNLDSELFLTLEANSFYRITCDIITNSDALYDIRGGFTTYPNASEPIWFYDTDSTFGTIYTKFITITLPGASTNRAFCPVILIETVDAGVFGYAWAQFVSGAVPSTVLKGSSMIATKLN